ncbi:MAG: hypothetical protein KBT02_03610 [Treponema sp.]|nr:hypothetical protein [Candidatus Treponema caballi]
MHTKEIRKLFLIVCLGCLFLCSCGLDEYYVIYPPACDNPHPYNQDDQMFYRFRTATITTLMSSQVLLKGTAIYYKIYPVSNESTMISDIEKIKTANTEFSSNGYSRITGTYKYQAVKFISGSNEVEYLSPTGSDIEWTMNLYSNLVRGDGTGPLKLIKAESASSVYDGMVEMPSATGDYYINAYAVTVGDVSLQSQYSQLAPLGVLKFTIQ